MSVPITVTPLAQEDYSRGYRSNIYLDINLDGWKIQSYRDCYHPWLVRLKHFIIRNKIIGPKLSYEYAISPTIIWEECKKRCIPLSMRRPISRPRRESLNNDVSPTIPFKQDDLITMVKCYYLNFKDPPYMALRNTILKYSGLCEDICNQILMDDLLGIGREEGFLITRITLDSLNQERLRTSHIMEVFHDFLTIPLGPFRVYPNNLLSSSNQLKLFKKDIVNPVILNREILKYGFRNVKEGEMIKIILIAKGGSKPGHSMILKKLPNNKFIFFNPNKGEYRNLTIDQLCYKLDEVMLEYQDSSFRDYLFITGKDYLKRVDILKRSKLSIQTLNIESLS